jgi:hypothetical protein
LIAWRTSVGHATPDRCSRSRTDNPKSKEVRWADLHLVRPEGATQEAEEAVMRRLATHIDGAHPIATAHIFLREVAHRDAMLAV